MPKGKRIWPKYDKQMEAQTPNQLLLFDMKEVITCGKSYKDYVRRQNARTKVEMLENNGSAAI